MRANDQPQWVLGVHALSRLSGVISALLIVVSLLVVCHMVFVRAVLGQSSIWQTEFVTFALIAATFLGAPYILLTRGHVNVDIVPLLISHPTRVRLSWLAQLLSLLFCVLFLFGASHWWWGAWVSEETTPTIWQARLWIPYLSVPVGLGLLVLQQLADLYELWSGQADPFGLKPGDRL